jgi:hypothetical protein
MLSAAVSQFQPLPYAQRLRQPRAIVTINGAPILWEDIRVQTTTFFMADNYNVSLPLYGQSSQFSPDFWSSVTDLTVKIYIGFPVNPMAYTIDDLELFLTGTADLINVDLITARVNLNGRDLSSRLIDKKTSKIYPNQTASNIAIMLANENNLKSFVTPTSGNVGRFFKNFPTNAQNLLTREITQWDLLTFLAQQSGFIAFVKNDELHFEPFPTEQNSPAYILNYQPPSFHGGSPNFYGTQLSFQRSLTLARDVLVHVTVPANPQTGKSFVKTARYVRRVRGTSQIPAPSGTVQTYNFIIAGLTPEQAQQQADSLAQNITIHEVVLSADLPGDNQLRKDSIIKIQGTNTSYDQIYFTDTVTRRINIDGGYDMSIIAKNHSTDSQIQL